MTSDRAGRTSVGTSDGAYAFSGEFWTKFHRAYWERRGVVLRKAFRCPLATSAEAFGWIVKFCERYRSGDRSTPIQFYCDQTKVLADVGKWLPRLEDASAAQFAERLRAEHPGRRFGLVIDDFHMDEELWFRLRAFLKGLYRVTGVAGETNATAFLGNYSKTPFGVHKGRSTNFMFVVQGRKRIRAWPDKFFRGKQKPTNSLDYEKLLKDAIMLEGQAGDVLYWPSNYWHIGEDAGGLSMAISLQIFPEFRFGAHVINQAAAIVDRHLCQEALAELLPVFLERACQTTDSIPKLTRMATRALRASVQDPQYQENLLAFWLKHATGFGFYNVPPPLPNRDLALDEVICGDQAYPILWIPLRNYEMMCAANGHAFEIPAHRKLQRLIAHLNTGIPAPVRHLIREYAGQVERAGVRLDATPHDVLKLLQKFVSLRAVSVARARLTGKMVMPFTNCTE